MDKAEYRVKLDQITAMTSAGDYENAQAIVDEIDWRRVKSARTLCMVSEIYEVNGRLQDSRRVLEIAYKRALVKTVVYRLVEVCLKLNDFESAMEYYEDFADLAPMDDSKYVLKYKICRAKGDPVSSQIEILEEYKEREYTERWAYELAKLYSQDGNIDACVETCDDLILWFSEGPYVMKAMELKRRYVPLSPSQQEKYRKEKDQAANVIKAAVPTFLKTSNAEEVEKPLTDTKTEEEEEEVVAIRTEEAIEKMDMAASTTVQSESGIKLPQGKSAVVDVKQAVDPARMQSQLVDSIRTVFAGINNKGTVQLDMQASEMEESYEKLYQPEEDMSGYEIKDLEPEVSPQERVHAVEAVVAADVKVSEESANDDQIKGQMSLDDFAKKETEFDFEALFAETTNALAMELASGAFAKTEEAEEEADEEAERKAAEEEAARKAAEEEAARKAAEEEAARKAAEEEAARKAAEEEAARKAAEEEAARKAAEEEAARKAAEEEAARKAAEEELLQYEKETDESLGLTREFNFNEELKKAMEAEAAAEAEQDSEAEMEVDVEEISDNFEASNLADELEAIFAADEAELQKQTLQDEVIEIEDTEDEEEIQSLNLESEIVLMPELDEEIADEVEEDTNDFMFPDDFEVSFPVEEDEQDESEVEEPEVSMDDIADELESEIEEDVPEELITDPEKVVLPDESQKLLKYVPVEPRPFTDVEREIFSYFTNIPGLSQQITETISDVHNNAGDKTSKGGNFLLIGRQGAGKTRLYDSMVLAICKDLDMKAVKVAKVIARDFNMKDPAAVVAKMSGGFLVIEGAGELSAETAEKLAQAMEFRTDGLVVVLEDEKDDLYNMLGKHPKLAEKFTSTIKIPVFTNDELVTFAKTYANEQGYKIDEMGILALYTKIGDNQKDAEPVTVGKVKEMMDAAMAHANRGHRKLGRRFSKNSIDSENRIILFEKDFE